MHLQQNKLYFSFFLSTVALSRLQIKTDLITIYWHNWLCNSKYSLVLLFVHSFLSLLLKAAMKEWHTGRNHVAACVPLHAPQPSPRKDSHLLLTKEQRTAWIFLRCTNISRDKQKSTQGSTGKQKKKSSDQLFILHSQVIDLRWGHYSLSFIHSNTFFPENLKSIPFFSSHTSGHQCGFDTGSSLRPLYNFPFGERKACQMLGKAA